MTRFQTVLATVSLSLATCPAVCRAGFVVDGVLDADYGAVKSTVLFDTTAPIGNFGSPGNTNHAAGYGIYLAADATNVYGFFQADRDIDSLPFSNIYFRTTASGGSNVGFEVTNERAFTPGVGGYFTPVTGLAHASQTFAANGTGTTLEFSIPWSFFTGDPLGMGFTKIDAANSMLQLRLSQTFGYSVAGGPGYGNARLGQVTFAPAGVATPAPAGLLIALVGGGSLLTFVRRRRRI